ncbi:MAG TPA: hypothetical protein VLC10_03635 [Patescibacteria group bacterium]|nr:hypothetical protein [Patescibacteria group bacterium]
MTIEEALAAIRAGEAQGKQKYAIRQELLVSGVPSEVVDAAMAAARGEAVPAPQPAEDASTGAATGGAPARPKDAVITRPTMPAWLLFVCAGVLAIAYVRTFSRFYGPNWTVQYLVLLLTWAWIWKNDGRPGLLGGIIIAALTAGAIFLAGVRMMTVGFGVALAYAIFGGRWQEGGAKAFIVVVNAVFLLWFLYGLANPEARQPFF